MTTTTIKETTDARFHWANLDQKTILLKEITPMIQELTRVLINILLNYCENQEGFEFIWECIGGDGKLINGSLGVQGIANAHCCALGNVVMKPNTGKYYWEIIAHRRTPKGGYDTILGVATKDLNLNRCLGYTGHGWGYSNEGTTLLAGRYSYVYRDKKKTIRSEETIGILYDSDDGTLSIYKDDEKLGLTCGEITTEVFPAISVYANSITLKKVVNLPKDY